MTPLPVIVDNDRFSCRVRRTPFLRNAPAGFFFRVHAHQTRDSVRFLITIVISARTNGDEGDRHFFVYAHERGQKRFHNTARNFRERGRTRVGTGLTKSFNGGPRTFRLLECIRHNGR